jgi:hypothetical protein
VHPLPALVLGAVFLAACGGGPVVSTASAPTPAQTSAAPLISAPSIGSRLPDRLSDAEYWKLETDISEPGGYFQIEDNSPRTR